jgi:hypothetical protein
MMISAGVISGGGLRGGYI